MRGEALRLVVYERLDAPLVCGAPVPGALGDLSPQSERPGTTDGPVKVLLRSRVLRTPVGGRGSTRQGRRSEGPPRPSRMSRRKENEGSHCLCSRPSFSLVLVGFPTSRGPQSVLPLGDKNTVSVPSTEKPGALGTATDTGMSQVRSASWWSRVCTVSSPLHLWTPVVGDTCSRTPDVCGWGGRDVLLLFPVPRPWESGLGWSDRTRVVRPGRPVLVDLPRVGRSKGRPGSRLLPPGSRARSRGRS